MSFVEPDLEEDEARPTRQQIEEKQKARRSARVSAVLAFYLLIVVGLMLLGGALGVAVRFFRLVAGT